MAAIQHPAVAATRSSDRDISGLLDRALIWAALAVGILVYIPTYIRLYHGAWQTEQEGHGPLILAAAAWLAWRQRTAFHLNDSRPAYGMGWAVLAFAMLLMIVGRSQDLLVVEAASQVLVMLAVALLAGGAQAVRLFWFPIAFLIFSAPPPGWMLDAMTVPLKAWVSDVVAETLYDSGLPIAQNGVMIMVGPYQLMVKDACSGMNSIFALSAIGFFYIHEFVRNAPIRAAILFVAILPVAIIANLLRVFALVLGTYFWGPDAVEGTVHDLTGLLLFIAAVALFFSVDSVLAGVSWVLTRRSHRPDAGVA